MHQLPQTAVNVRVPLTTRAAVLYLQCAVDKQLLFGQWPVTCAGAVPSGYHNLVFQAH